MYRSRHKVNLLCFQPTYILHERHHVRLIEISTCVSPYHQLSAAIHLCRRKSDQISELVRDRHSFLEYPRIELLGSRRRIGEIVKKVKNLRAQDKIYESLTRRIADTD